MIEKRKKGGQPGNNNSGKNNMARQALQMAIASKGAKKDVVSKMKVLYEIWRVQVEKAMDGDQAATDAIMNRLDGKPFQSIQLTGDEDNPIAISKVERVIVSPTNTDR